MSRTLSRAFLSWAVVAAGLAPRFAAAEAAWPAFRGPGGNPVAASGVPTEWDAASGKGVLWKTAIPLPGSGSPIVWGDRVYLSGADAEGRGAVFALDAKSGRLLWRGDVPLSGKPDNLDEATTFAAPTPVTDGKRVFAVFATGAIAAFNADGSKAWGADLGVPAMMYGYASSPVLWKDLLIVQYDQDTEGESALIAFNTQTGKESWRAKRDLGASWCSPLVAETGQGPQVVVASCGGVAAYDPKDGRALWIVKRPSRDISSTPIFAKGLVIATLASAGTLAIRPDGMGDVTATHIAWENEDAGADVASPVAVGDKVFVPSYALMCLNAADGKPLGERDVDGTLYASPVVAGGVLYLVNREGKFTLVKADPTLEPVGKPVMGEPVDATPAVAGGTLFVRTRDRLYALGSPAGAPAPQPPAPPAAPGTP